MPIRTAKATNRPGRKLRLAAWACFALAFVTVVAWIVSAWWAIELHTDRRGARLWDGALHVWSIGSLFDSQLSWQVMAVFDEPNRTTLNMSGGIVNMPEPAWSWKVVNLESEWQQRWWYGFGRVDTPQRSFHSFGVYQRITIPDGAAVDTTVTQSIALWPIALLCCCAGALSLKLSRVARRRAALNLCANCGYNLAGLAPAARCPECGKTAAPV